MLCSLAFRIKAVAIAAPRRHPAHWALLAGPVPPPCSLQLWKSETTVEQEQKHLVNHFSSLKREFNPEEDVGGSYQGSEPLMTSRLQPMVQEMWEVEINWASALLPHQAERFHLCKETMESSFPISLVLRAPRQLQPPWIKGGFRPLCLQAAPRQADGDVPPPQPTISGVRAAQPEGSRC